MRLRPIEAFAHVPKVDDVPDEVEVIAFDVFEKIEKGFGLAPMRAKVKVGHPNGPIADNSSLVLVGGGGWFGRVRERLGMSFKH
jgi:hypothetical protein